MITLIEHLGLINFKNKELEQFAIDLITRRDSIMDDMGLHLPTVVQELDLVKCCELPIIDLVIESEGLTPQEFIEDLKWADECVYLKPKVLTDEPHLNLIQLLNLLDNPESLVYYQQEINLLYHLINDWLDHRSGFQQLNNLTMQILAIVFPYTGTVMRGLLTHEPFTIDQPMYASSYTSKLDVAKFHAGFGGYKEGKYSYILTEEVTGQLNLMEVLRTFSTYHKGFQSLLETYEWESEVVVISPKPQSVEDLTNQFKISNYSTI